MDPKVYFKAINSHIWRRDRVSQCHPFFIRVQCEKCGLLCSISPRLESDITPGPFDLNSNERRLTCNEMIIKQIHEL
jgi:hypothetical protein